MFMCVFIMSNLTPYKLTLLLIFTALLPVIHSTCQDGYYISREGTCRKCWSSSCISCENNRCKCNKKGYYPTEYSDWCHRCPPYCYNCTSRSQCNYCHESCLCPANCLACTSFFYCRNCQSGYYGESCEQTCSEGCTDNTCIRQSGQCSCKDSWHGELCNKSCPVNCKTCTSDSLCFECKPGYYGTVCDRQCSSGCLDSVCNQNTGVCIKRPCRINYRGEKCDYCVDGYFGEYCMEKCPNNCRLCFSNTSCFFCQPWLFGETCENKCSDRCLFNKCYSDSGLCFGCKQYFTGLLCEHCLKDSVCNTNCPPNCLSCSSQNNCFDCKSGYYGDTCQLKCSSGCLIDVCDKENGSCELSSVGCKNGFEGDSCQKCVKGKYGVNCSDDCPSTCAGNVCEQTTGNCMKGCTSISAMYGVKCEKHCPDKCRQCTSNISCDLCDSGHWGDLCEFNCSEGCLEDCSSNGTCTDCKDEYYGNFCDISCPENCLSGLCNDTGSCFDCSDGLFGDQCKQMCSVDCCNRTCYRNGSCMLCNNASNGKETGYSIEKLGWFVITGLLAFTTLVLSVSFVVLKRRFAQRNGASINRTQTNRSDRRTSERPERIVSSDQYYQSAGYEIPINEIPHRDPANNESNMNIYSDVYDVLLDEGNDPDEGKNGNVEDNISIPAYGGPYESPLNEKAFNIDNHENGNDNITLHIKHGSYERPLNEEAFGMVKDDVISYPVSSVFCEKQPEEDAPDNCSANASEKDTYLTPIA